MGTPVLKLVYDRNHRASNTKEGAVELRITYNRKQKHVTTGVRLLPRQWRQGCVVNRTDAFEVQHTLDMFVAHARRVISDLMERGELDMRTVVQAVGGKLKEEASANVPGCRPLVEFFRERAMVRGYGLSEDSRERYARFLRWFEKWGGMQTFDDVTEVNILHMDEALTETGMKPYSKWQNYHRFLNSFIMDAMEEGLLAKNPYKRLHIQKNQESGSIGKYLTLEELGRVMALRLPVGYLRHARDLFVFQTYTCLAYADLAAFDASKIVEDEAGRKVYHGRRGKTGQEFVFLMLKPALDVLAAYGGKLPLMSNEKYNQYLKLVVMAAGIDKPVSSHWARHTGATLLLNGGVGMETVAKVLGHSSPRITRQVYAKLLDDTVVAAMEDAAARLGM